MEVRAVESVHQLVAVEYGLEPAQSLHRIQTAELILAENSSSVHDRAIQGIVIGVVHFRGFKHKPILQEGSTFLKPLCKDLRLSTRRMTGKTRNIHHKKEFGSR